MTKEVDINISCKLLSCINEVIFFEIALTLYRSLL